MTPYGSVSNLESDGLDSKLDFASGQSMIIDEVTSIRLRLICVDSTDFDSDRWIPEWSPDADC